MTAFEKLRKKSENISVTEEELEALEFQVRLDEWLLLLEELEELKELEEL